VDELELVGILALTEDHLASLKPRVGSAAGNQFQTSIRHTREKKWSARMSCSVSMAILVHDGFGRLVI
jgi:hypothetical protein